MDPGRIEKLRNPAVFCGDAESVEIVQTHLSVVCLVGEFAYKLKKSIRLPFADFSTLKKRKYFCEEELRLNRRLCPEVYLEVLPLWRDADGSLSFRREDAGGEIVDYAVRMRRLPAERMLDVLLEQNAVTSRDVEAVAAQMVGFHARADRGAETLAHGAPEKLREFAMENFSESRDRAGDGGVFPEMLHGALQKRTASDFDRHLERMEERAKSGCVVDGHGDLHARNICLTDPVAIYDCIEFNPAFRCGDVATEHAFLIMDLRYRGHPELASVYFDAALAATGDAGMREIMPMLIRYRAMVRAKVAAIAAGEGELAEVQRRDSMETARRYLRLAAVSAIEEDGPWWLMLCGLPASGKSSIAGALARASGGAWPVFSSDRIRKELAGVAPEETLPESFYRADFSRRTYDELRSRAAAAATEKSRVIILDANFREKEERALTRRAAREVEARLAILSVDAAEESVIARLDHRASQPDCESDADRAVYRKLKAACEPPDMDEADRLLSVSGDGAPEAAADDLLAAMLNESE